MHTCWPACMHAHMHTHTYTQERERVACIFEKVNVEWLSQLGLALGAGLNAWSLDKAACSMCASSNSAFWFHFCAENILQADSDGQRQGHASAQQHGVGDHQGSGGHQQPPHLGPELRQHVLQRFGDGRLGQDRHHEVQLQHRGWSGGVSDHRGGRQQQPVNRHLLH